MKEEDTGEEPPLNNMGALSIPILTSDMLRPTEEQGIKTKRHHVQVNVRGQAERKYRVTAAYTSMNAGSTQSQNLLIDGEITPIKIIMIIQTLYKMQEWIKQSIRNTI